MFLRVALTGLEVLCDVTVAVRDGFLVCDHLDVGHHHAAGRLLRGHRKTLSGRQRERQTERRAARKQTAGRYLAVAEVISRSHTKAAGEVCRRSVFCDADLQREKEEV